MNAEPPVHEPCPHGTSEDTGQGRRLTAALALVVLYGAVEAVSGLLAGSLALLADAGHMLTDATALALALAAQRIGRRTPDARRTFGYRRLEVLAALANGVALVGVGAYLLTEAVARLRVPHAVDAPVVVAVGAGGLLVNVLGLWFLRGPAGINVRAAWLHMLSDALSSVQVVAAGVLLWTLGWSWADPVASLLIGVFVLRSSWLVLKEAVGLLLESVPEGLDLDALRRAMLGVADVRDLHELHVWSIAPGFVSLSAHVRIHGDRPTGATLADLREVLEGRFSIEHSTLQLDLDECCVPVPEAAVPDAAAPGRGQGAA